MAKYEKVNADEAYVIEYKNKTDNSVNNLPVHFGLSLESQDIFKDNENKEYTLPVKWRRIVKKTAYSSTGLT